MNEQMFKLRFQLAMGQTETLNKMRELRKDQSPAVNDLAREGK